MASRPRKKHDRKKPSSGEARILRWLVYGVSSVALVASLCAVWILWPVSGSAKRVEVTAGSLRSVVRQLNDQGVPTQYWVMRALYQWTGRSFKIGSHDIAADSNHLQIYKSLLVSRVVENSFRINEGWNNRQLMQALAGVDDLESQASQKSESELAAYLGLEQEKIEGWLFPDTYRYASGSSEIHLIQRAHQEMRRQLADAWEQRLDNLPLKSPYELLILASIVEKETGRAHDRAMIAGVFVNRLRKGMRLQSDPTVIYGMGSKFDGNLRRKDLEKDTRYNSYTRTGLPPTPIAFPGQGSLLASANPANTKALYFVARGDGSTQFSNTLREHNRAVVQFQLRRRK